MTNKTQPAFWTPIPADYAEDGIKEGMLLRDYFAAKAMAAFICANPNMPDDTVAKYAYATSDAMLSEREKNG